MRLRKLLVKRLLTWLGLWAVCCVLFVFAMGQADIKNEYSSASEMVDYLHRGLAKAEPLSNIELQRLRQQLAEHKAEQERLETRRELYLISAMLLLMAAGSGVVVWYSLKPALNKPLQELVQWLHDYEEHERDPTRPIPSLPGSGKFRIAEFKQIHESIHQLVKTLDIEQQKSRDLLNRVVDLQERERQAIAQDLHDYFGQSLTSISVNSAFLIKNTQASTQEAAKAVHEQAQEMMGWLRGSLRELKPHLLLEVSLRDAALDLLDNWAKRQGWYVDFAWAPNTPPLQKEAPIAIYRTLQEALTNAARHASTKKLKVLAGFDEKMQEFILIIENDGVRGPLPVQPSLGLTGIRERMARLQGRVIWNIEKDKFVLRCHIPITE
ncbi:MAG: histidine kinase [Burkholderiales bacterium]|jgi:two-component system sensor histidine kinase UhpB|uniref:sensor histidine kinase n=1 Tax=Limnobacter sp. TaxID=2003368 RepID=UPI003960B8C3|nr:histidine kinase [Burkholderiales bacterium]